MSQAQTDPTQLVAPGNLVGNHLGASVSTDGDVIVGGAPTTPISGYLPYSQVDQQTQELVTPGLRAGVSSGGMAIFRKGVEGWDLDQYLPAPFGQDPATEQGLVTGAAYGESVAVSGDQILVGSPGSWFVRYQKDVDCPYVNANVGYQCGVKTFGSVGEVLAYEYDASRPEGDRWVYSQLLGPPGNFNWFGFLNPVGQGTFPRPQCNPAPPFQPLYCNYIVFGAGNYTPSQYFGTAVAIGGDKYAAIGSPGPLNPPAGRQSLVGYAVRIYWHGSDPSNECASLGDPYALPPKPPPPLGTPCWHEAQTSSGNPWTINAVQPRSGFGAALAISSDGQFLVVGAPYACNGTPLSQGNRCSPESGLSAGAAYVYEHNGQPGILGGYGPNPVATLLPQNPGPADLFGVSVAIDGNRIAVGANLKSCEAFYPQSPPYSQQLGPERTWGRACNPSESGIGAGAAYIFSRDGGGTWTEEAVLQVPGSNLYMGSSVALEGDDFYAGAPGYSGSQFYEGAAIHFRFANGAWNYVSTLKTRGPLNQEKFGTSIAMASTTLAIGAPTTTGSTLGIASPEQGRVYAYTEGATAVTSSSTAASKRYSLNGMERMKIWSKCRRGRDRITADFDLSGDGHWQATTSTGYSFGGASETTGRSGRKLLLRFDEESFAEYQAALVEWSQELCEAPVTQVEEFTHSSFNAKLNKARTGLRVRLKTRATGATSLGSKKTKHSLAGKGRAD